MKTADRQHKRMQELMGVKTKPINEQPDRQAGTSVEINPNTERFAQGYVGASQLQGKMDKSLGWQPLDQGYVNRVVLELLQGTGRKFGFTYLFLNEVKTKDATIKANTKYESKDAQYLGTTQEGNTIIVPAPETEETEENEEKEKQDYNRNKKIVEMFKLIGKTFNTTDPFVPYFRKNIRPVLRRLKKEFPEYKVDFLDQATKWEGEEVVVDHFITTNSILIEGYKDNIKQLKDLEAAKIAQKKDPKMVKDLENQIKKEKQALLRLIKPKFSRIYLSQANNFTDEDMINHALYMDIFLERLKKDYPQYKINYGGLDLTEETIEVGKLGDETKVEKEETNPKTLTINLRKEQLEVYLHRTYPCTVSIDGEYAGENQIKIIDIESEFAFTKTYKGMGKGKGQGQGNEKKKEEGEGYTFPRTGISNEKGKTFSVTMSINNDPLTIFRQGQTAHSYLRKHASPAKYTVVMMDNGFQLVDLDASVHGQEQEFPQDNDNRIRFLFGDREGVDFGNRYSPTVISGNETESAFGQKLDITIDNIKPKTAGW